MTRFPRTLSTVLVLFACAAAVSAQATDQGEARTPGQSTIPAEGVTLMVHIRDASHGRPAPAGLPVEVLCVKADGSHVLLDSQTDAGGVARADLSAELLRGEPLACSAGVAFGGHQFFSKPFIVIGEPAVQMVSIHVYEPLPQVALPRWSYAALLALVVLAAILLAARRSDGLLP